MRIALSVLIALPAAVPAQAIDYHGIFNDGVYRRVDPPIVNEEELKAYERAYEQAEHERELYERRRAAEHLLDLRPRNHREN